MRVAVFPICALRPTGIYGVAHPVQESRWHDLVGRVALGETVTCRRGGCHFMHVEPWLNPEDTADLWYFEGPPDESAKLKRIFDGVPNRVMFAVHYHKWLLATPEGIEGWAGDRLVVLDGGRFFVTVGAVCEGRYATSDTGTSKLTPFTEE